MIEAAGSRRGDFGDAEAAAARYPWRDKHPYPTCFVCGPHRAEHDGLEIYPGPVADNAVYAAPWIPRAEFADADGVVRDEFVWAALDCPSGIVTTRLDDVGLILLGRLAAHLVKPVRAADPCVVQAWTFPRDGRKLPTASALFGPDGDAPRDRARHLDRGHRGGVTTRPARLRCADLRPPAANAA